MDIKEYKERIKFLRNADSEQFMLDVFHFMERYGFSPTCMDGNIRYNDKYIYVDFEFKPIHTVSICVNTVDKKIDILAVSVGKHSDGIGYLTVELTDDDLGAKLNHIKTKQVRLEW